MTFELLADVGTDKIYVTVRRDNIQGEILFTLELEEIKDWLKEMGEGYIVLTKDEYAKLLVEADIGAEQDNQLRPEDL